MLTCTATGLRRSVPSKLEYRVVFQSAVERSILMALENGDICTQVISFTIGTGDEFQNKFTWRYAGTGMGEGTFIGLMDSWAEDFYELAATYLKSTITSFLSEYDKITYNSESGLWEVSANIGTGSGTVTFTDTEDMLPFQCCPTLVGFTERPKSRGRKSPPLFCEDSQAASSWSPGAEADIIDMLTEYLLTYILQTNHSVDPGIASTITGTFLPFLSGLVKDIVFTQRRRTKGRGS